MGMKQYEPESLTIWKRKLRQVAFIENLGLDGHANPLIFGKVLVAIAFSPGLIYGLNKKDGQILWKYSLKGLTHGGLRSYEGHVYGNTSRQIVCLRPRDGKVIWTRSFPTTDNTTVSSGLEIKEDCLYFGDSQGYLHCLCAQTGQSLWKTFSGNKWNDTLSARPLAHKSRVYTSNSCKKISAFDKKNGQRLWSLNTVGAGAYQPTVLGDRLVTYSDELISVISLSKKKMLAKESISTSNTQRSLTLPQGIFTIEKTPPQPKTQESLNILSQYKKGRLVHSHQLGKYIFNMIAVSDNYLCLTSFEKIQFYSLRERRITHEIGWPQNSIQWPALPSFEGRLMYIAQHHGVISALRLPFLLKKKTPAAK